MSEEAHQVATVAAVESAGVAAVAPTVTLRAVFARFWPDTKPLRGRLYVTLVLVVVAPVLSTAGIAMFKVLIDRVVVPHDFHLFPLIALIYLGLTLVQGLVSFTDQYLSTVIGERFVMGLRMRLFHHLHRLSLGFFESRPLGDVLSRLTGDIGAIENVVLSAPAQALTYVIKLLLYTGAMFFLDWRLAGASLVAAPGFLLAARVFSRRIKAASREKRRRSAAITTVAEESFSNAALVRAYDRAESEDDRFQAQNLAVYSAQMTATRLQALFGPLTDVIEVIGVLLVIGLAVWELTAGRISIGGLLVFMAYMAQLYSPIQGLSSMTNSLYAAGASAERVIEFLDETPSVTDPPNPTPLNRAHGDLALHQVSFTYPGTDKPTLSNINVHIPAGETIALVGASGTGKSTLAKLLLRFYDPTSGTISLDGIDVRQLRLTDLYRNVATVLQETLVFDATVRENILWGRPEASERDIINAAIAADAHEFIEHLPHGYDTAIGQRGRKLSGGQRQRLAIARAMIRNAPVLLLDEPTTGLDAHSTARVLAPLRQLIAGRTTIIISHNLATVTDADRILYLENGTIAATGTHTQLLRSCPGYRHLYQLHQQPSPEHSQEPPQPNTTTNHPTLGTDQPPQGRAVPAPNAGEDPEPTVQPHIRCSHLSHRYPDTNHNTVTEISFSLHHGGCIALEGPSGTGKSSLLRLLTGELQPTSGTITYNGVNLNQLDQRWLAQRIALIDPDTEPPDTNLPDAELLDPQPPEPGRRRNNTALTQDTVVLPRLDLLGRPPPHAPLPELRATAIATTGASVQVAQTANNDIRHTTPHTNVQRQGGAEALHPTPSRLQRRQASIRRALRTNPDVLLLDNPTKGLDPHDRNQLLSTLCLLAENHTMLIVTTDPVVRALAHTVIDLQPANSTNTAN